MVTISQLLSSLRGAIISSVNPKFARFKFALTLAVAVAVITLGVVALITWTLLQQCTTNCRSIPIALVVNEQVSKLSCVALSSTKLTLSESIQQRSVDIAAQLYKANRDWKTWQWTTPGASLTKCSYKHANPCALREWIAFYQGMIALQKLSTDSSILTNAGAWPTGAVVNSTTPVKQQMQQIISMDTGVPLDATSAQTVLGIADLTKTNIIQVWPRKT